MFWTKSGRRRRTAARNDGYSRLSRWITPSYDAVGKVNRKKIYYKRKIIINLRLSLTHRVNLPRTFTTKYPPPTQRHTEQEIWKKVSCFFSAQNEVVKRPPIHQLPKGGTRKALSTQRNHYCSAQPATVCGCRRCLSKWRKAVLWIRPASEALPGKAWYRP